MKTFVRCREFHGRNSIRLVEGSDQVVGVMSDKRESTSRRWGER